MLLLAASAGLAANPQHASGQPRAVVSDALYAMTQAVAAWQAPAACCEHKVTAQLQQNAGTCNPGLDSQTRAGSWPSRHSGCPGCRHKLQGLLADQAWIDKYQRGPHGQEPCLQLAR